MKQCPKTCKVLYQEFCDKFTPNQIESDFELRALYRYLVYRCSMNNGDYIHEPREMTRRLIIKHLLYDPKKEKPTPEGEPIQNNANANVNAL